MPRINLDMAIELRPASREDMPFLKEMCHMAVYGIIGDETPEEEIPSVEQAMTQSWFSQYVEDWGREGDYGLIVRDNGIEAGAAWYRKFEKDADKPPYELTLAVKEEYRQRKIGHTLLNSLLEHAKSSEISEMSLYVRENNRVARALYERLGFRPIGEESVYTLMAVSLG